MLAEGFTQRISKFIGCPADILSTETVEIFRLSPEHYTNLKLRGEKKF